MLVLFRHSLAKDSVIFLFEYYDNVFRSVRMLFICMALMLFDRNSLEKRISKVRVRANTCFIARIFKWLLEMYKLLVNHLCS